MARVSFRSRFAGPLLLLLAGLLVAAALPARAQENSVFLPLVQSDPAGMVLVPAGPFEMGCSPNDENYCRVRERPQHTVTLSAYYIDKTEVSNARYAACVRAGACTVPHYTFTAIYYGNPLYVDYPVVRVDWN